MEIESDFFSSEYSPFSGGFVLGVGTSLATSEVEKKDIFDSFS